MNTGNDVVVTLETMEYHDYSLVLQVYPSMEIISIYVSINPNFVMFLYAVKNPQKKGVDQQYTD